MYLKYVHEASFLPFQTRDASGDWVSWPHAFHPHSLPSFHPCSFTKITGGLDQLPKALSASLKPGTILLGSKMEMVVRDGPQVQISYQVGEPHSVLHTLTTDFVIVSASVKATRLITFKPPFSLDKVDALRSVHYTSATKVVLACNEPFWEQDGIRDGVSITDWPSRSTTPATASPAARASCWPPTPWMMILSS